MSNKLAWKVTILLALIVGAFYYLYPNFVWYSLPLDVRQEKAKRKDPLAEKVVPLGLDLQGGVHLVYQVDTSKLPDEAEATVTQAVDQNMLVINNRIDAMGVANPFVARQGRDLIVVQLPGVYESEAAKRLIGQTALLEFRLVRGDKADALADIIDQMKEKDIRPEQIINNQLPEDIKKLIPAGLDIMPSRDGGYLFVNDKADLTGAYLKKAYVDLGNTSQMGGLAIQFELNSEGAKLFRELTGAHVSERLAIVLDRTIQSAPTIQDRIPDGSGQITGSFSVEEARNLSHVLNSGNLQAPMVVVEERTVGPQMGEDSIRRGLFGSMMGFLLVVAFMWFYYKTSGFLADIALVLNLVFTMVFMNYFKASLTMPGIAGLILSLAMAVDANVLILERIREELDKGKQIKFAIDEGYSKAFSAILDGNITTLIAALFLFQFGTGPVRGFGITLTLGLCISMVTAIVVTRIFYEIWFSINKPTKLSV